MKTPTAQLGANGGPQHPDKRKAGGHGPTLEDEVVFLLPTPKASDGTHGGPNQRDSSGRYYLPGQAVRVDAQWLGSNGKDYGPAVRRWEGITGHTAPCPTEDGTRGNRRLNPAFSEWMMGIGPGRVTDIVTDRNDALHVIGNGVVPRQAEAAFRFLMDDSNWSGEVDDSTKQEKPRGKCTGCAFEYQLSAKGLIRKHNSRTGPGLCSGANQPPESVHANGCTEETRWGPSVCSGCGECQPCLVDPDTCADHFPPPVTHVDTGITYPKSSAGHCVQGRCTGCCGCSSMCTTDPCGQPEDAGLPVPMMSDVVAVAPGGIPVFSDPAPVDPPTVPVHDGEADGRGDMAPMPDPFQAPGAASVIPDGSVSMQPEPDRDRYGRYVLHGAPYTRATTFAKAASSTFTLNEWQQRMTIAGLVLRPDLMALAHGLDVKQDRKQLNSIAEQAKEAAGQKVAANLGTAYHAFSERLDAGLITLADVPPQYRPRLEQYANAVRSHGLVTRPEWIERTVAVRADQVSAALPVAGTLDRIFQLPNGELVIGDLKTGADLSYGWGEIAVQLALYAHGVNTHGLFDWRTKTWETAEQRLIRTDFAIVMHLPAGGDGCTLHKVDLVKGWQRAQVCGSVMAMQADKGALSHPFTPADVPAALTPPPAPVRGEVGQMAAEWEHAKTVFRAADSQQRLAELYQYAMDSGKFHTDQLATLVGIGKDRLAVLAGEPPF